MPLPWGLGLTLIWLSLKMYNWVAASPSYVVQLEAVIE